jgi:hypothetical protein
VNLKDVVFGIPAQQVASAVAAMGVEVAISFVDHIGGVVDSSEFDAEVVEALSNKLASTQGGYWHEMFFQLDIPCPYCDRIMITDGGLDQDYYTDNDVVFRYYCDGCGAEQNIVRHPPRPDEFEDEL